MKNRQKEAKLTRKQIKAIIKGPIDNGKKGTARRLNSNMKKALIRDYYMKGLGYMALSKKYGIADTSIRTLLLESKQLSEFKKEMRAKAKSQAERLAEAYSQQALDTVKDAKGLQAVTSWGITQSKLREMENQEEKAPEGRGIRITYSAWDQSSRTFEDK